MEGPISSFEARLFGPWEAWVHGQPLPALRSRRAEWLLAFLLLQGGRPAQRAWLAGLFWPESDERRAQYNLRRNLSDLRRALGPEARRLGAPYDRSLCLDMEGVVLDVAVFDRAIARGNPAALAEAVGLYRGPLLPECVESWVLPERAAREEAYLDALERLSAEASRRGDHADAAHQLRLAAAVDPLRESTQQALLQALTAAGDLAGATLSYREFRLRLHRELNAAPSPEIEAAFDEIRRRARTLSRLRAAEGRSARAGRTQSASSPPAAAAPIPVLPQPISSFVGRESELAEVVERLAPARLLTLTGPGGVGKTRLALRVAETLLDEYRDGVWFVDLAALTAPSERDYPALVAATVARTLGIGEPTGRPIIETLPEALRDRELLLILDNCEHVLAACAMLAVRLLGACPHLRVLSTSRQSLGVPGEIIWTAPPLSLPPQEGVGGRVRTGPTRPSTPDPLSQYEAVHLFAERGRAACREFTLTPENMETVVQICRRLDGMPLALELAAARLRTLPVEQLAARLDDRFHLLTSGPHAALPRHQTLRNALDWSFDLLSEPERVLLRRLSIFPGGFTLPAAEAVCGSHGVRG